MIFEELVVHNFGPYAGRHTILLSPPSRSKPVTLLGGLNGAGKTSLLDALSLALYGKRARCSKRGEQPYDTFLAESIHRGSSPHEGAGVELAFLRHEAGRQVRYRVRRTWSGGGATVRDRVEVFRDQALDTLLTECWNDQVEDFIPSGVAELFLFDGEKIERLADIDRSQATLQTAMQSLLGLGIVEQLENDLVVLERRKRVAQKGTSEQARLKGLEAEVDAIRSRRTAVKDARAAAVVESETAARSLEKVEERLRRFGGDLYAKRAETEKELAVARTRVEGQLADLRDLAGGALPLLLVESRVRELLERTSSASAESEGLLPLLKERDETLIRNASLRGLAPESLALLAEVMANERAERAARSARDAGDALPADTGLRIRIALEEALPGERRSLEAGLSELRDGEQQVDALERVLAATPQQETIEATLMERERARLAKEVAEHRLKELDTQLGELTRELETAESKLAKELENQAEHLNEQDDAERLVSSAVRTREILSSFRRALLARHADRLGRLILGSFQQLLRKDGLVHDLTIDPATLEVQLKDADGLPIKPDRLSAGERQLLAVSMLWGLAQASGRPLPTVIDTPMGRLDSTHRERLIERYFPRASHQVLLLSTDEEIKGGYLDSITPYVGRSYHLVHDNTLRRSSVQPGYFW